MSEGDFCRILTLLRKERGMTQKQAAQALGVSQALLSHYEKGVRECGLDFVIRAADFYGVSCDYLLGRSADRNGTTFSADEMPDETDVNDNRLIGSLLPTLNKKLLVNSLNVLYGVLQRTQSKKLVMDVSAYLMTSVYRMFRKIYSANPKNQESMFSISKNTYDGLTSASMCRAEAHIARQLSGECEEKADIPAITTEKLSEEFPVHAPSFLTLIQQTEKLIDD